VSRIPQPRLRFLFVSIWTQLDFEHNTYSLPAALVLLSHAPSIRYTSQSVHCLSSPSLPVDCCLIQLWRTYCATMLVAGECGAAHYTYMLTPTPFDSAISLQLSHVDFQQIIPQYLSFVSSVLLHVTVVCGNFSHILYITNFNKIRISYAVM
jgi:hypothetical protein